MTEIKSDVAQSIDKWKSENKDKIYWLVLCHGHAYSSVLNLLPESLQKDVVFFMIDVEPEAKPDLLLDITKDLYKIPSGSFDGVISAGCYIPALRAEGVFEELERISKSGAYWIDKVSYINRTNVRSSNDIIDQLIASEDAEYRMPNINNHFNIVYKFDYRVPDSYKVQFKDFMDKVRKGQVKSLKTRTERKVTNVKARALEVKAMKLELFKEMFKMTPEEFVKSLTICMSSGEEVSIPPLT